MCVCVCVCTCVRMCVQISGISVRGCCSTMFSAGDCHWVCQCQCSSLSVSTLKLTAHPPPPHTHTVDKPLSDIFVDLPPEVFELTDHGKILKQIPRARWRDPVEKV